MSATMAPPVNASSVSATDRSKRFDAPMASDLARIRSEYIEMPGLVLTLPLGVRPPTCGRAPDCTAGRWVSSVRPKGNVPATAMTAGDEEAFMVGHIEILAADDESLQRPAQLDVKPLQRVDGDTNASSDVVDDASNQSFPASDPPPWTLGVEPR